MSERGREEADSKQVDEAMAMIKQQNYACSIQILLSVVKNTPKTYQHTTELDEAFYMRFWDQSKFVNFVQKASPSRQT